MSGIVGIFNLNQQPVDPGHLTQMIAAQAHRGPDGANSWLSGPVGLGHGMLHTTPESLTEQLPLAKGGLAITADARIDNRHQLLPQLGLDTDTSQSIGDSEIILAAYEQWGEQCPEKLLGDFSFVIWDRCKQQIFCARDHFGIKPFYYYQSSDTIAFASEIKALLSLSFVPKQINNQGILDHLTLNLGMKVNSAYENIWRIPPAHTLVISDNKEKTSRQYWSLNPEVEIQMASDADYEAAFLEIFTEAVRCRLRSALPVGSHLSGGLDSSSIVCIARDLLKEAEKPPLHTFSSGYPTVPKSDERDFFDAVIQAGDVVPHYIRVDCTGPLTDHSAMFDYVDEPLIGNGYLTWELNKVVGKHKIRVLLNGFDGDTTISHGMLKLHELALASDWKTLVSEVNQLLQNLDDSESLNIRLHAIHALQQLTSQGKHMEFLRASWALTQSLEQPFYKLVQKYGFKGTKLRRAIFKIRKWRQQSKNNRKTKQKKNLVSAGFVQQIFPKNEAAQCVEKHKASGWPKSVREQQWQSISSGLEAAMEVVDLLSSPYGIEPRYPFMDKRLIEFCLALPAEQKLKNGWTRSILRRAMQDILPEKVQWRNHKTTPNAGFRYGLDEYDAYLINELLQDKENSLKTYVDTDVLRAAYGAFREDRPSANVGIGEVWSAFSLGLWLQKHDKEELKTRKFTGIAN